MSSKPSNGRHANGPGAGAAGSGQQPSRVVVQDYIARVRYSNTLPPPPTPPKLLEIPSAGIGQYTNAGFAARLAREQQAPTIEADAELGMPLDLVGVPGVLFEDDSILMAAEPAPVQSLHPADRALLKPFSQLGRDTSGVSGIPFLRRTEYISAGSARNDSSAFIRSKNEVLLNRTNQPAGAGGPDGPGRRAINKDDPSNIVRHVLKGFDLAYPYDKFTGAEEGGAVRAAEPTPAERDAWEKPRHPTNPSLRPLDTYPVLFDFAATPDTGAYIVMKFKGNPVGQPVGMGEAAGGAGSVAHRYDDRLDVGLFHVVDPTPDEIAKYQEQMEARERDPTLPPAMPKYDFDLFLPGTAGGAAGRLKRRLSTHAPDRDDDALYDSTRTHDGEPAFKLSRVRRYETFQQAGSGPDAPFAETVGLALHDAPGAGADGAADPATGLHKAAYIYGVGQRTSVRPKRAAAATAAAGAADSSLIADAIELTVRDRTRRELRHVRQALLRYDDDLPGRAIPELAGEWEESEPEPEPEQEQEQEQDGEEGPDDDDGAVDAVEHAESERGGNADEDEDEDRRRGHESEEGEDEEGVGADEGGRSPRSDRSGSDVDHHVPLVHQTNDFDSE